MRLLRLPKQTLGKLARAKRISESDSTHVRKSVTQFQFRGKKGKLTFIARNTEVLNQTHRGVSTFWKKWQNCGTIFYFLIGEHVSSTTFVDTSNEWTSFIISWFLRRNRWSSQGWQIKNKISNVCFFFKFSCKLLLSTIATLPMHPDVPHFAPLTKWLHFPPVENPPFLPSF